jgi:hypothetical protein
MGSHSPLAKASALAHGRSDCGRSRSLAGQIEAKSVSEHGGMKMDWGISTFTNEQEARRS